MIRTRFPLAAFVALSALSAIACRKEEEVPPADSAAAAPAPAPAMVTTIETGRTIGADKRIADTASTIRPNDTLFVSVVPASQSEELVETLRAEAPHLPVGERLHVAVLPTITFF